MPFYNPYGRDPTRYSPPQPLEVKVVPTESNREQVLPLATKGINQNQPLDAQDVDTAVICENWFPTPTALVPRRGYEEIQEIVRGEDAINTFMRGYAGYKNTSLAVSETKVWLIDGADVTELAIPQGAGFRSNNELTITRFLSLGNEHLIFLDGQGRGLIYDDISGLQLLDLGIDVDTRNFSSAFVYNRALYFVNPSDNSVWYLPGGFVQATADQSLSRFGLGGILQAPPLFGGNISTDSGAGLDDRWVIVGIDGSIAVYTGISPSSDNWGLQGTYQLDAPLGVKAWTFLAGDMLILTKVGLIPLSQVITNTYAVYRQYAFTSNIHDEVQNLQGRWNVFVEHSGSRLWLVPEGADRQSRIFVMNLQHNAWCVFTGMVGDVWGIVNDEVYFIQAGTTPSKFDLLGFAPPSKFVLMRAWRTSLDNGKPIQCRLLTAFVPLVSATTVKVPLTVQITGRANAEDQVRGSEAVQVGGVLTELPNIRLPFIVQILTRFEGLSQITPWDDNQLNPPDEIRVSDGVKWADADSPSAGQVGVTQWNTSKWGNFIRELTLKEPFRVRQPVSGRADWMALRVEFLSNGAHDVELLNYTLEYKTPVTNTVGAKRL